MNVRSLKLAGAAAGLLFLVGAAPNVYAGTDVLDFGGTFFALPSAGADYYSLFTFSGPLILNEIGFVTHPDVTPTFYYQINNEVPVNVLSTTKGSYDLAWHTLSTPMQMNTGDSVKLFNYDGSNNAMAGKYNFDGVNVTFLPWTSSNANVTFGGFTDADNNQLVGGTVGNIRVSPSNPSANVAPEPGSIALLLTGGGALAGIALRRRRNAG
jgi:hypothetical protein